MPILILLVPSKALKWWEFYPDHEIIPNVKMLRCCSCKWFFNLIDKSKSNVTFPKTPSGGQKSTTLMMIMMIAPSLFFFLLLIPLLKTMLETNRNLAMQYILFLEVTFRNYTFFRDRALNRDNIRFDTKIVCQMLEHVFFSNNDDSLSFSNTLEKSLLTHLVHFWFSMPFIPWKHSSIIINFKAYFLQRLAKLAQVFKLFMMS